MIILFDVDGVLVEHRAYHAALQQTVAYFSRRLGLGEFTLTETDIEVFESQTITTEWDSGAISVAALLMARSQAAANIVPAETRHRDIWELLKETETQPVSVPRPDFSALARRVGAALSSSHRPGPTARALFLADQTPAIEPLLTQLLSDCYNIDYAPVTQISQNYVLGHRLYAEYYGLPPRLECEPLLEKLDRSCLNADMRDRLLARRAAGEVFPVLYTARPSLAPSETNAPPRGYTPEAEIARTLVGLDSVPVMGSGKIDWLARQTGEPDGTWAGFVKPAPLHALAAIAVARTGAEVAALQAALAVTRGAAMPALLADCAGETVHVFEDSAGSLKGVTDAVALLNQASLGMRLVCHGIAAPDSPKRAPLEAAADFVHADVNAGLAQILA